MEVQAVRARRRHSPHEPHPLAVFAPVLGARSETFIRRHVRDLLPDRTVTLTYENVCDADWSAPGPGLRCRPPWRGRRAAPLRPPPNAGAVQRFLQRHGVSVFLGEYLDASLAWLDVARRAGLRFYAHAHGYDVSQKLRHEHWRTDYLRYNESDGVITMSEDSRRRLVELGVAWEKIHVIPYGVDVPDEPRRAAQSRTVPCVSVGRFVAKKSPLLTLRAFAAACARRPQLRLEFVGGGELLDEARAFVESAALGDAVSLRGPLRHHDVLGLLSSAELFVQHSVTDVVTGDEEGLPVAILEAMAAGLPVVSTQHAGIREAVVDGTTGFLVDEGDWRAMADRLVQLADDRDLRDRMGHAGWFRARARFTWERERSRLLELLGLEGRAA